MNEKIFVSRLNEVYIQISCENQGTEYELSEYFTFFIPNHFFDPRVRNKLWDGKIRLFNRKTRTLYYGLLKRLEEFAKERSYELILEKNVSVKNNISIAEMAEYIKSLDIHSQNKPLEPRDYQLEAVVKGIRNKRNLFISPTASGKSYIFYCLVRYLLGPLGLKKGIIVVPTINLVNQMYSDFEDYSSANGWNVEKNIHKIFQGQEKISGKKLLISTWQSIFKMDLEYFKDIDFILGDEADSFQAKSLVSIMTKLVNTEYRIGMTGTLDGGKTNKMVLEGLFGPHKELITTKELMNRKQVSELKIKCLVLKYPEEMCKELKKSTYIEEIDCLVANEKRNRFIKNLALSLKGNTLILYRLVEKHGKLIHDLLEKEIDQTKRRLFFVHGKVSGEEREKIRPIIEESTNSIGVMSVGTFSRGVNIRHVHNIIFASPSKGRIRVLQSIGRGLRLGENKDIARLYDISDDLRYKSRENHTFKHFIERINIYNEQKFVYNVYEINLY